MARQITIMKKHNVAWQTVYSGTPPEDLIRLQHYCELVSERNLPSMAIEIGTHEGASTALLAEWFDVVICVDPWGDIEVQPGERIATFIGKAATIPQFTAFVGNMERLNLFDRIVPIVNTVKALDHLIPQNVALAFVDDGHTYHDCSRDIKAALRHLAPAGLLVCHDYFGGPGPCGSYVGVQQAVDEAVEKYGLEIIDHFGSIVALQRKEDVKVIL
jgi:predicted O-methyltransferase YrrM